MYRKRLILDLRLLRLTKSREKCPLLQLGWGSFPGGLCFKSPVMGPAAKPLSPPCHAAPRRAGRSPSRFGTGAGGRGGAPGAQVVLPLLQAAPAGVHEEVADGGELQAQLLGDGDLHFFGGALVLLEDGEKCSALEVRENQAGFLLGVVPLFVRLLLFAFAGWGRGGQRQRERASVRMRLAAADPAMDPADPPDMRGHAGHGDLTQDPQRQPCTAEPAPRRTWGLAEEHQGVTLVIALASQKPAFSEIILGGHLIVGHSGTEFQGNWSAPPPSSDRALEFTCHFWLVPNFEISHTFYKATI